MFGTSSHMPIRKSYWYSVARLGELRYELRGTMRPLRDAAVDAAEDYHGNHDGWESAWPIDFYIYESEDGPPVGRFEVERETVPQFHAWERDAADAGGPDRERTTETDETKGQV